MVVTLQCSSVPLCPARQRHSCIHHHPHNLVASSSNQFGPCRRPGPVGCACRPRCSRTHHSVCLRVMCCVCAQAMWCSTANSTRTPPATSSTRSVSAVGALGAAVQHKQPAAGAAAVAALARGVHLLAAPEWPPLPHTCWNRLAAARSCTHNVLSMLSLCSVLQCRYRAAAVHSSTHSLPCAELPLCCSGAVPCCPMPCPAVPCCAALQGRSTARRTAATPRVTTL